MYNESVEFRDWFWGKFEDWRKGTTKGPTAFARYLEIEESQYVSAWLNGKYKPKSLELIAKIAEKYPDVYEILGIETIEQEIPFHKLPGPMRKRLVEAFGEWTDALNTRNLDPESAEAIKLADEIFGRHGLRVTPTEEE